MLICFCCIIKFNYDSDMCWDEKKYRKKNGWKIYFLMNLFFVFLMYWKKLNMLYYVGIFFFKNDMKI